MLFIAGGLSQERQSDSSDRKKQGEEKGDKSTTRSYEKQTDEGSSSAGWSFGDAVSQDFRNHVGFSIGAYEIYARNQYPDLGYSSSVMLTAFYPRVFANFGRRRSRLNLGYGYGYGFDNKDASRHTQEQTATVDYSYAATRSWTFRLSDYLFSSPNYYGSILQPIFSPGYVPPIYTSGTVRLGQRQLRNDLSGSIGRQLTRKTNFSVFANYYLYRYETDSLYNGEGASVGASFGYQPKKWLTISTSYSRVLVNTDPRYSDATINRVQVGQFDFRLSSRWRAACGGGVDIASYYGQTYTYANANASLSRSSRNNTLSFNYNRGFSTSIGTSRLYKSDSVTANFGQRIQRRISFMASASYWHNADLYAGGYNALIARAGLEFLLAHSLVASAQYAYQHQLSRYQDTSYVPDVSQNLVYFGLQYFWPGARQ